MTQPASDKELSEPGVPVRQASIRDVARAAGVSPATVSKVHNGYPGVSAKTRDHVLALSRELDYQPNQNVRGIFARRSFTIGLITSDSFGRFSGPIMTGVESTLQSGDLSVIMADSRGDVQRERQQLAVLRGRRVDGLIVTGRCSNLRPPVGTGLPFPVVYAHTPSSNPEDFSVVVDDWEAGFLATEHLVAQGRKRIAHVTGPADFDAVQRRMRGYCAALSESGLSPGGAVKAGYWCEAWGREAASHLLEHVPELDAVYCGSDLLARGVLDALREAGRSVPDDVAVVGTDNWRLMAEATRPPLTTIDLRLDLVGRRAAQGLLDAIGGHAPQGTEKIAPELVVRLSSDRETVALARSETDNYHESCIH